VASMAIMERNVGAEQNVAWTGTKGLKPVLAEPPGETTKSRMRLMAELKGVLRVVCNSRLIALRGQGK